MSEEPPKPPHRGENPDSVVTYAEGRFSMAPAPSWWREEEWFSSASVVTSFEIGPLRNGVIGRQAPEGVTVCLVANDEHQDVRMLWCPTEADYAAFLCGPGAIFASTCAQILAADPLKRGTWK